MNRPDFNQIAKIGFETMFTEKWDDLPENSIDRALWIEITNNMANEILRQMEGILDQN